MEGSGHSPRTQGARLELLVKLDRVHIAPCDNPVERYMKMEEYARAFRSSSGDMQHINERKFLNALPTEYDVQKQMLEDNEGEFLAGGRDDHRQKTHSRNFSHPAETRNRCTVTKR